MLWLISLVYGEDKEHVIDKPSAAVLSTRELSACSLGLLSYGTESWIIGARPPTRLSRAPVSGAGGAAGRWARTEASVGGSIRVLGYITAYHIMLYYHVML